MGKYVMGYMVSEHRIRFTCFWYDTFEEARNHQKKAWSRGYRMVICDKTGKVVA